MTSAVPILASAPLTLGLRPGLALVERNGQHAVVGDAVGLGLGPLPAGVRAGLERLAGPGDSVEALNGAVEELDGFFGVPHFELILGKLRAKGFIQWTLSHAGRRLLTLRATGEDASPPIDELPARDSLLVSQHVLFRNVGGRLQAESGLSRHVLIFEEPALASWCVRQLDGAEPTQILDSLELPGEVVLKVLCFLCTAQVLRAAGRAQGEIEDLPDQARQWEFHDLYFHSRSRLGRGGQSYGGTYRFKGTRDALPVSKPPMSDVAIDLPVPDLEAARREDPPLAEVMETRRSHRIHGERPITLDQLGEFLYRTVRERRRLDGQPQELSQRSYPSGGAVYELEVYVVLDRCEGLDSGLYHYRADHHELRRVTGRSPEVEALLDQAWVTIARQSRPQILFVFAARFGRVSWKYQSMAYALILKHVGVVMQTFYLVATAMGLAPCALGGGDSDLFARASGLDWLEEGAVGEFILGTLGDTPTGGVP